MRKENNYFKIDLYSNFIGTENYYKYSLRHIKFTDGITYIMKNGLLWFVEEIIFNKKILSNNFVSIKLEAKNNKGVITWRDDEEKKYKKYIDFTDFFGEITLFFCNDVLMLASEY